jgi:hypothetical protein
LDRLDWKEGGNQDLKIDSNIVENQTLRGVSKPICAVLDRSALVLMYVESGFGSLILLRALYLPLLPLLPVLSAEAVAADKPFLVAVWEREFGVVLGEIKTTGFSRAAAST